ncbi:imidazoleglycerol-phosphate dehydratase HisB [candidate division KSB1 bacterium]|nr:imidazoleglycerol-phosphate dehydratase HisB [candidate division KSB1 bacterium]
MRKTSLDRKTNETDIRLELDIDGSGRYDIDIPIGFLKHMFESFAKHGLFDLTITAKGDLNVDQHHLVEDLGILLGRAFREALGDKRGINRAGYFVYPMDEALAVVAIDLSGRPYLQFDVELKRRFCGDFDSDLLHDFFQGFAANAHANVVVRMPFGRNDHHKIEAIFKAFGKSMNMACSLDPRAIDHIPSTKGMLNDDSNS